MNKGHLLYVTFNFFRVEDLCILSIGRKMYFLSGVNYKQCCTMKVLNNESLNSGQAFSEQRDQLVIDKGLGPLIFCSPIPYFRGSRVSIPVIQLLLLEIERTHSSFSSSSAKWWGQRRLPRVPHNIHSRFLEGVLGNNRDGRRFCQLPLLGALRVTFLPSWRWKNPRVSLPQGC